MCQLIEPKDDPDEDPEDGNLDEDERADDLVEEIWLPDPDSFFDDDDHHDQNDSDEAGQEDEGT